MKSQEYLQRLHELLEGELPIEQEEELFWRLATEEELRAAFRELVVLNRLLRQEPEPPSASVQEALLEQLGLTQRRPLWRHPYLWVAALLGAIGGAGLAVVGFLLLGRAHLPEPVQQPFAAPTPAEVRPHIPSTPPAAPSRVSSEPQGQPTAVASEPVLSSTAGPALTLAEPRLLPLPSPTADSRPVPLPKAPNAVPYRESPPLFFSLRSLGAWEYSWPDVALPSRGPIGLRDVALGVWTPLAPGHAVGLEIGSEAFSQEFSTRDGVLYRQRPTLLWAGPSYWWSMASTPSGLTAELRFTVAATLIGPVGKLWLGTSVPLGASAHALVGLEGSLLGYRVDGTWFVSRKAGLSYGITLGR